MKRASSLPEAAISAAGAPAECIKAFACPGAHYDVTTFGMRVFFFPAAAEHIQNMRTGRVVWLLLTLGMAGCSAPRTQTSAAQCAEIGLASWYRTEDGRILTADGERYHPDALTAAHRFLPFGTEVLVTDLATGRSIVVRINDRGPFIKGRIIDLSSKAAQQMGMRQQGVVRVRLEVYRTHSQLAPAQCPFRRN